MNNKEAVQTIKDNWPPENRTRLIEALNFMINNGEQMYKALEAVLKKEDISFTGQLIIEIAYKAYKGEQNEN